MRYIYIYIHKERERESRKAFHFAYYNCLVPNLIRDTHLRDKHNLVTIPICICSNVLEHHTRGGNPSKYLFFNEKHDSHIKLSAFD